MACSASDKALMASLYFKVTTAKSKFASLRISSTLAKFSASIATKADSSSLK